VARDFDIDIETRGLADLIVKFKRLRPMVNKEYFEYAIESGAPTLKTRVKQQIWYSGIRPDEGDLLNSWETTSSGAMVVGIGATGSSFKATVRSFEDHAEYLTTGVPPHSIPKSGKMPPGKFMWFNIKDSNFPVPTIGEAKADDATRKDIPYGFASTGDPPVDFTEEPVDRQKAIVRNAKRKMANFYRDGFIFAKQVNHPGVRPYDYVDQAVSRFVSLDWKKSRPYPLQRGLLKAGFTPTPEEAA